MADIIGINNYTNPIGPRNTLEDFNTSNNLLYANEGVKNGLIVTETSPQSAAVAVTTGSFIVNCGDTGLMTFKLETAITSLAVPNTGVSAKRYLVCAKVDITNATADIVVIEGTAGTDPNLVEGGSPDVYYLPIARIDKGISANVSNSEISQTGTTNNSTPETIYRQVLINTTGVEVQGIGDYSGGKFSYTEIEPGGDGRLHVAVFYESDTVDSVKVSEIDEKGIHGSVRQQTGSHFEAFTARPDEAAGNPIFRLTSFQRMSLSMGTGYEENDVHFQRFGKNQFGIFTDFSNLADASQSDASILGGENNLLTKAIHADGESWVYALATEQVDYDYGDWTGASFGANLVTNGTFASDTSWTKGTGWTIGSGVATHAASAAESNLTQNITVAANKIYEINVTVSGRTAGWLEAGIFTKKTVRMFNNQTYQFWIDSEALSGSQPLIFKASPKFNGSIDNVTVYEFSNWSFLSGLKNAWKHITGTTTALTRPSLSITAGNTYQVSFVLGSTLDNDALVGSVDVSLGGDALGTFSTKGMHVVVLENATASNTNLVFTPTSDFNGYIQNASVRLASGSQFNVLGTARTNVLESYLNNTSTSPQATIEQDGTGDASLRWVLTATRAYSMGIDNSETGDPLAISAASGGLGTNIWLLDNLGVNTVIATKYLSQASAPAAPASGFNLYSDVNSKFAIQNASNRILTLDNSALTASREYELPDSDGTLALLANDDYFLGLQALGSPLKAQTLGISIHEVNTNTSLADGTQRFVAVYLPRAQTITGVSFLQRVQGDFTGDNENSIALYSYSAGNLTRVAISANDETIWKNAANTFAQIPFTSPYVATAGIYFVGLLYNNSAVVANPQIAFATNLGNTIQATPLLTNSAKLTATLAAQTAQGAGAIAMSTTTAVISTPWVALY